MAEAIASHRQELRRVSIKPAAALASLPLCYRLTAYTFTLAA